MSRFACFAALVLAAGAIGCSSTPKPPLAQASPSSNSLDRSPPSGVVPAGFQSRLSSFDAGKDCKT